MSDVQQAYNSWAHQYDSNENKTRDLEARSLRETLASQLIIYHSTAALQIADTIGLHEMKQVILQNTYASLYVFWEF